MQKQTLQFVVSVTTYLAVFVTGAWLAYADADERDARKGFVTANVLNVRARPGETYEVVAKLQKGDTVEIVEEADGWYGILPPVGTEAWCAARFVDADGRVTGDDVRVRSGKGVVFSDFARLQKGAEVTLRGLPEDGWQRIAVPEDAIVWVSKAYIQAEPKKASMEASREVEPFHVPETMDAGARRADIRPADGDASALDTVEDEATMHEQAEDAGGEDMAGAELNSADTQRQEVSERQSVEPEDAPFPAGGVQDDDDDTRVDTLKPPIETAELFEDTTEKAGPGGAAAELVPLLDLGVQAGDADVYSDTYRQGVLLPLGEAGNELATHVLAVERAGKSRPKCYVRSGVVDLASWEHRLVRVYGEKVQYSGWRLPVIVVTGIQLEE